MSSVSNDNDAQRIETALRFLESISKNKLLTEFAMKNMEGAVISAMALAAEKVGEVKIPEFAKVKIVREYTDSDFPDDRSRTERNKHPPSSEDDVF